jgi:hypothetical protein
VAADDQDMYPRFLFEFGQPGVIDGEGKTPRRFSSPVSTDEPVGG